MHVQLQCTCWVVQCNFSVNAARRLGSGEGPNHALATTGMAGTGTGMGRKLATGRSGSCHGRKPQNLRVVRSRSAPKIWDPNWEMIGPMDSFTLPSGEDFLRQEEPGFYDGRLSLALLGERAVALANGRLEQQSQQNIEICAVSRLSLQFSCCWVIYLCSGSSSSESIKSLVASVLVKLSW